MDKKIEYKIVDNNGVSIVSLKGNISRNAKSVFDACKNELTESHSKVVIFYFKDVTGFEHVALRELVILLHETRKNNQRVLITGLTAILKKDLCEKGVIRLEEIKASLEDALKQL